MGISLKSILSSGAGDIIKSVGDVVDNLTTSKEEKEQAKLEVQKVVYSHEEKLADLAQAEVDSYLKDTQDARLSNTRIQESDKASWLSKNSLYILALLITFGFFGLLYYMLKYEIPPGNKDVMNILLGSLGTAWITIIGFFFGSSLGSKANGDALRNIVKK